MLGTSLCACVRALPWTFIRKSLCPCSAAIVLRNPDLLININDLCSRLNAVFQITFCTHFCRLEKMYCFLSAVFLPCTQRKDISIYLFIYWLNANWLLVFVKLTEIGRNTVTILMCFGWRIPSRNCQIIFWNCTQSIFLFLEDNAMTF